LTIQFQIAQPSPIRADKQRDIEAILASIPGLEASSPRFKGSRPGSVVSSRPLSGQRLSSGSGEQASDVVSPTSNPSAAYASSSTQTVLDSSTGTITDTPLYIEPRPQKAPTICYEKATQTDESLEPPRDISISTEPWTNDADGLGNEAKEKELEKLKDEWLKEKEEELRSKLGTKDLENSDTQSGAERIPIRTLDGEELNALVTSDDFKDFLDKSSKIADRALDEPYDILVDYAQGSGNLDEDDDYGKDRRRRGRRVKQISQFWDEKWSRKRMVTDIGFSPRV
jgi:dynein intermediate chain, cytosolic